MSNELKEAARLALYTLSNASWHLPALGKSDRLRPEQAGTIKRPLEASVRDVCGHCKCFCSTVGRNMKCVKREGAMQTGANSSPHQSPRRV